MKNILAVICFIFTINLTYSQWVPYTNFPTTNRVGGVSIPGTNSNYVYVATFNASNPNQTLLVKSTNRGNTWLTLNTFPPFFSYPSSIAFYSNEEGIALGTNMIIATTNGGNSWGVLYVAPDTVVLENFAISPNTSIFWAIGNKITGTGLGNPVLIRSSNFPSGPFVRLTLPQTYNNYQLTGLCVKGNSTCLISTNEHPPVFLKTINTGENWSLISAGNNDREIWDMIRYDLNDDVIAVGGNMNCLTIYNSTDFGETWLQTMDIQNVNGPFRAVGAPFEFIRNRMYSVGHNGTIYATTNSGQNWFKQISNLTSNLKWITKSYPDGLFAVTWGDFESNSDSSNSISQMQFTTNGGSPIGIQLINSEIPNTFSLSQNYPNPFNPVTKIRFDVPRSENVMIKVYDMLGKEITTLVNQQLQPGTYETDWDATGYSSGIYYYKMISGNFTQTKIMVLVK